MRDEHYSPFKGPPPEPSRLKAVTVFVMARQRDDSAPLPEVSGLTGIGRDGLPSVNPSIAGLPETMHGCWRSRMRTSAGHVDSRRLRQSPVLGGANRGERGAARRGRETTPADHASPGAVGIRSMYLIGAGLEHTWPARLGGDAAGALPPRLVRCCSPSGRSLRVGAWSRFIGLGQRRCPANPLRGW